MAIKLIISVFVASLFVELISAQECVQCNSSDTAQSGFNCIVAPTFITPTPCFNDSSAGCFSRIVNGSTIRGCVSSLPDNIRSDCKFEVNQCDQCINILGGSGCNNYNFPAHRLHCHQCSGNVGTQCAGEIGDNPLACSLYKENDQCYIRRTNETVTRGCVSEFANCSSPDKCYTCSGNGCNSINGTQASIPEYNFASRTTANVFLGTFITFLVVLSLRH